MSKLCPLLMAFIFTSLSWAAEDVAPPKKKADTSFTTETIQGRVVWLGEALDEEFGISSVKEARERILAIHTKDGQLLPILENLRGRAFRTDDRLRDKSMEIVVRRHKKQPMLQVIRIYEFRKDKKYEVDYWCDVCAIVMFEKGFCACCQDTNRLRHRLIKVETKKTPK